MSKTPNPYESGFTDRSEQDQVTAESPGRQSGSAVSDTVADPRLRIRDNLRQVTAVVCSLIGSCIGWVVADDKWSGALVGVLVGMMVSLFIGRLLLNVIRRETNECGRRNEPVGRALHDEPATRLQDRI